MRKNPFLPIDSWFARLFERGSRSSAQDSFLLLRRLSPRVFPLPSRSDGYNLLSAFGREPFPDWFRGRDFVTMLSVPDYDIILLDLDGTLTDPTEEMISAAAYALKQFGIKERDPEKLKLFTTVPLLHCFEEHFGLTREQADQAFIHYWYYAGTFGVSKNRPYDGIPEMLQKLRDRGKTLCIATARQTKNVEQIVKALDLEKYFTIVLGASEDDSRRTKKMIIFDLLCQLPDHEEKNVIMVGDREVDITGARDNAIDSMAVTYGAEPVEDLLKHNPTYVVNSVSEMAAILLGEEPTASLHMSSSVSDT